MTDLPKLTGSVRTMRPQSSNPYGIPWSNIARYATFIDEAATRYGAEPERIAAHIVIESDGEPKAVQKNNSNGWSYGLMQVVPFGVGWAGWWPRVESISGAKGADRVVDALYDPRTNILVGTSILADFKNQYGSWDKASSAFFTGGSNWGGNDTVNGTTGAAYRDTLNSLMAEIRNQTKPQPANPPSTTPQPATTDPIAYIVGGSYPPITYGWLADAGLNYYVYGVGHGTQRASQHTGVDVGVPDHTPLYAPAPGKVLCVGEQGQNVWGQGCGAYTDTGVNPPRSPLEGVGNITILLDSGHKLTLGHCDDCLFRPGDRVKQGDLVGHSGGQNGYHVHIEVAIERNGTYWLTEPIAALKEAMKGTTVEAPVTYAARIDIPQPAEFETGFQVEVTADSVPVKQYADMSAPDVAKPLVKGETFTAPYIAYGRNGKPWWISMNRGRVPVAGTKCDALDGVL